MSFLLHTIILTPLSPQGSTFLQLGESTMEG